MIIDRRICAKTTWSWSVYSITINILSILTCVCNGDRFIDCHYLNCWTFSWSLPKHSNCIWLTFAEITPNNIFLRFYRVPGNHSNKILTIQLVLFTIFIFELFSTGFVRRWSCHLPTQGYASRVQVRGKHHCG